MKKEVENQDGIISEGIAKAKKAVKRSSKATDTAEQKTGDKKDAPKKATRHTVTRKAKATE